jgi:hypothetical protein
MNLNLPILPQLQGCQNILVTGIGGGYDIFCGLPIYFALQQQGFNVHLANYSFADIKHCSVGERLSPNLVGVRASEELISPYFPEYYLSQWFAQARGQQVPIWAFEKTGVEPLAEGYALLQQRLQFDAVVLVDGGVDSLARGDEAEAGTLVEDAISLAAVRRLAPGLKACVLACVGLGAERDLTHAHIFENMAALAREGAFLGSCSLTAQMPARICMNRCMNRRCRSAGPALSRPQRHQFQHRVGRERRIWRLPPHAQNPRQPAVDFAADAHLLVLQLRSRGPAQPGAGRH